ncbi:MAG: alpha/beta hydrolase [Roseburia sp.]|nr:alpha/beta hydrolase [Roseburia sp.]
MKNPKTPTERKAKKKGSVPWGLIYTGAFIASFIASAVFKMTYNPLGTEFSVNWDDSIGWKYADIPYGEKESNRFDLYVPADNSREGYGLIVYLHAGGFTGGDKSDDTQTLEWLCSKGYVTAGINYTLFSEANPDANVYTQSMEIKESMPYVIAEAERLGYHIDEMAVAGGSAGGCHALLYAYRDADTSPVPVRMVFEGVSPSSFYPEDWSAYGLDKDYEAAAGLFSVMSGKPLTADMFGTEAYDEAVRDISALLWVNENTVPTLCIYGAHDKVQPFAGSERLAAALEQYHVPHDYIVCRHSGHGLQNDNREYIEYMRKISEYLDMYMPVKVVGGEAHHSPQ